MSGDPSDPEVSHGACSMECWNFHAALREFRAELLDPDPLVAQFAVRMASLTTEGVFYEVSLLVGSRETEDRYGDPIAVPSGLSWNCDCRDFCQRGEKRACKHINRAIHLATLQGRMKRYQAERAAS